MVFYLFSIDALNFFPVLFFLQFMQPQSCYLINILSAVLVPVHVLIRLAHHELVFVFLGQFRATANRVYLHCQILMKYLFRCAQVLALTNVGSCSS